MLGTLRHYYHETLIERSKTLVMLIEQFQSSGNLMFLAIHTLLEQDFRLFDLESTDIVWQDKELKQITELCNSYGLYKEECTVKYNQLSKEFGAKAKAKGKDEMKVEIEDQDDSIWLTR